MTDADYPPPVDELDGELVRLLADYLARRDPKPEPWSCPVDGEPLRAWTTTYAAGGLGAGARVGSRYEHVDGTAHGDSGSVVRIGLPDGSHVAYDVVDERPSSDGSSTLSLRPQGRQ